MQSHEGREAISRSDMGKNPVEWARYLGREIERIDEQRRPADLPEAAAAQESPKLVLRGSSFPGGLLLERAEGSQPSLCLDDPLDRRGSERTDQLVFKIRVADEEPELLQVGAREVGAEARPLEAAPEVALLAGVTETRELEVHPVRAEPIQEPADGVRAPDGDDGDALGVEISAAAPGERFDSALVADAFDEHHRPRQDAGQMKWIPVHDP